MSRIVKTITACVLALVMTAISPMTDLSQSPDGTNDMMKAKAATVAKAAETGDANGGGQLYISDIRLGNAYYDSNDGPTEDQVVAELERDGYIVLKDGSGYADLNAGADAPYIKEGPTKKKVLLGYKTTTDPKEAITDLAVMNMKGGYSVQEYTNLMNNTINSQIKPFVDKFLAAIEEYRENLKKPEDSLNYKRADFSRRMMNYLIDDDTGNRVGDLIIKKTKYEMGDEAYNKLSDAEKKEHADIVTMLMQGNGKAVLMMERLLAMACDTEENSWFDRFIQTSLDSLVEEIRAEKPNLTTKKDIYAELDKRYSDSAKELLKSWDASANLFDDPEELLDETKETIEEHKDTYDEAGEVLSEVTEDSSPEEIAVAAIETQINQMENETDLQKLKAVAIGEHLDTVEYGSDTALDFFRKQVSDFSGDEIRALYPLVASLSSGQRAGLEFLSVMDLLTIAFQNEEGLEGMDDLDEQGMCEASFYEEVDRDIYEPGGVAMTSEALRKNAAGKLEKTDGLAGIKPVTIGLYACTAVFAGLAIGFAVYWHKSVSKYAELTELGAKLTRERLQISNPLIMDPTKTIYEKIEAFDFSDEVQDAADAIVENPMDSAAYKALDKACDENGKLAAEANCASEWGKNMTIAFSVVTIAIIAVTVWMTIADIQATYRTKYTAIPKIMVEETDITTYNEKGEKIMINNQTAYYRAALCNRIKGNSRIEKENYDVLLDRADLNGDIGKQWLALYYVKYKNGTPILADSLLYRRDGGSVPSGYSTGIHEFGSTTAVDLNKKSYLYADEPPAIHVFFQRAATTVSGLLSGTDGKDAGEVEDKATSESDTGSDTASGAAGSIFSDGSDGCGSDSGTLVKGLALGGGIGIVLGALLMALILFLTRRKKVSDKA